MRCQKPKNIRSKIRNQLPGEIKSKTSYTKFNEYIDTWFGHKYSCNVCMNIWKFHQCKMFGNTCQRVVIYFVFFTDTLAPIWYVLYYGFYYFSFVNFKLLLSEGKYRLLTYLLASLISCLAASLLASFLACMPPCLLLYFLPSLLPSVLPYFLPSLLTYLLTYLLTCLLTYLLVYLLTYMLT